MKILDLISNSRAMRYCYNIRGTNGSGKTSLARMFTQQGSVEVMSDIYPKKPSMVYCPQYNVLLIGSYRNKCGGCDTLVKAQIVRLLRLAWMTDCNIIFEGVLVSDSKEPYYWYLKELNDTLKPRDWGFVYLDLSLDTCLKRVQERNGGKEVKTDLIAAKHRNMLRYRQWQQEQGFGNICAIDAEQPIEQVFAQLLDIVGGGHVHNHC